MKAILFDQPGGPEVLYYGEAPDPVVGPDDLLVRVRATAVNRADTLQRRGNYPPPPGASPILGLELAGEVVRGAGPWQPEDRVMAVVTGGGYAELASVPVNMAMRIPANLSFEKAAAIPEAFLTAYLNLFMMGHLQSGETALIHAGASGVGTAAIQLARAAGAKEIVTAGSEEKLKGGRDLGADGTNKYNQEHWQDCDEHQRGRLNRSQTQSSLWINFPTMLTLLIERKLGDVHCRTQLQVPIADCRWTLKPYWRRPKTILTTAH